MKKQETITSAIQSSDIEKMIIAYKEYSGNASATSDDLFVFLTLPSGEREEFLQSFCNCEYLPQESIVSLNYYVK